MGEAQLAESRRRARQTILFWTELGLTAVACAMAFCCPRIGAAWFSYAEQQFARLARRRRLAVLLVGVVAIAARTAVLPILPVPEPRLADEYSFLLAAETFAHGRLTNPTPHMSEHFQTLHVLEKPSYMSMYPPAQGLFLAGGLFLTGTAFAGVLLSVGLMCAAICWMLQGWFSPGWALLGGFLAVVRFDMFNYWANSYWGGAIAALGGALALGALPRIVKHARIRDAIWMGIGLVLLANSRPYEGMVFSLPVAVAILAWLWKGKAQPLGRKFRQVVVPLTLVLAIAGAGMGYYFWRVTGSPFEMPEQLLRSTRAVAPYFLWMSPRPVPVYHVAAMRHFYLHGDLPFYEESRSLLGLAGVEFGRSADFWLYYLGPALTLPLLLVLGTLPFDLRWSAIDRSARFLIAATAFSIAGLAIEAFFFPHYAAPMTVLVLAMVILAMRRLRGRTWRGRPMGLFVTRAVPLVCLLMLVVRAGAVPLHIPITPTWPPSAYNAVPARSAWVQLNRRLESYPGKQLVLVRYSPQNKSPAGYVYNGAEIRHAKVLWAWDMGTAENERLIRCYKGRTVWLLNPLPSKAQLIPYAEAKAKGVAPSPKPPAAAGNNTRAPTRSR